MVDSDRHTWAGRVRLITSEGADVVDVVRGEARLHKDGADGAETWGGTLAADTMQPFERHECRFIIQLEDTGAKAEVEVRMTGAVASGSRARSLFTLDGRGAAPF